MLSPAPILIYYPTVMVRYSLFVLKVPLNPKQPNKKIPYDTLMSDTQRETCSPETDGWVGTVVCSYPP